MVGKEGDVVYRYLLVTISTNDCFHREVESVGGVAKPCDAFRLSSG